MSAQMPSFDLAKVVGRSRAVSKQLNQGVTHLMKKNKITVHMGDGALTAANKLTVTKDGKSLAPLKAPHIILATGARARALPGIEADGQLIWSHKPAMVPTLMPTSLLVICSGAPGIEFATFYRTMGPPDPLVAVMSRA